MPLRHTPDASPAGWIRDLSYEELVTFGPPGFEAYARVRFIPDPVRPGQSENDVDVPAGHLSDLDRARRTLDLLSRHTRTADQCYVCVWDGYGELGLPDAPGVATVLHLPHRSYTLLEGPLDALRTWESDVGRNGPLVPPALVWPADHRWCFVSDVDPHWAGVGSSRDALEDLFDDPVLDVVAADPRAPQPSYD